MTTHYVSRVALLNVYEMLYALGEDSRSSRCWSTSTRQPRCLAYTLTLRRGVKFHNGKTMDSKDVAYTFKRIMGDQGVPLRRAPQLHQGGGGTDPSAVKITLNASNSAFLAALANVICPVVVYPDGEAERQGGKVIKPVGTGPYEFVEWKKDAYLRVKKFKDYAADSRPTSGLAGKKTAMMETVDFIPIRTGPRGPRSRGRRRHRDRAERRGRPAAQGNPGLVVGRCPGSRSTTCDGASSRESSRTT